jgi:hypothetical protein
MRPPAPITWTVYLNLVDTIHISLDDYKVTARQTYVGDVEAVDEHKAIEKAAAEFKVDARRLIAFKR